MGIDSADGVATGEQGRLPEAGPGWRLPRGAVIITGAGGGIGAAIALAVAAWGASTVGVDVDPAGLEALDRKSTAQNLQLSTCVLDVRDQERVRNLVRTVARREGLAGLVHCAGVTARAHLAETPAETFRDLVEVNLTGTFNCLQAASAEMRLQRAGSIVVITSVNALRPLPSQAVYSATKAGLESLVRSLAVDLAAEGVRVNAIAPGAIATAMNPGLLNDAYMAASIPIGRVGMPADLVGPTLFLLSDASAYVTGATLVVDGGLLNVRHTAGET